MRIAAISDTHGTLPNLPGDVDLVLHAGDVCPDFARVSETGFRQAVWVNRKFGDWMPARFEGTWGNHDRAGSECEDWVDEKIRARFHVDEMIERGGLKIWFAPWSNKFGWTLAFMKHPYALLSHYELIPEGIDVLVSHQPPMGFGGRLGNEELGSKELLYHIQRVKPKVVICGHIHGGHGKYRMEHVDGKVTEVYNVAIMTEAYEPRNPATMIEIG